jgi:KDO transferase-3
MTRAKDLLHRACLRLLYGRDAWHRRHYRPGVHVVEGSERTWFEEAGRTVETLALPALSGRFSGRCNLLLSGPSVRAIPGPQRLAEHDWIGVNGSPALFDEAIPRMRIYHVNDSAFIRGSLERFLRYAAHAEYTIVDFRAMYEILRLAADRLPSTTLVVYDSWNLPHRLPIGKIQALAQPPRHRGVYWSDDPRLGIAPGGTVAYTAAQIAWHAGYDALYLYGLDLTDTGRFYHEDKPQPQMLDKSFDDVIVPAFELLMRQTSGRLAVYNCNPASRLPGEVVPQLEPGASFDHVDPGRSGE